MALGVAEGIAEAVGIAEVIGADTIAASCPQPSAIPADAAATSRAIIVAAYTLFDRDPPLLLGECSRMPGAKELPRVATDRARPSRT